jgi:hypothetical protein
MPRIIPGGCGNAIGHPSDLQCAHHCTGGIFQENLRALPFDLVPHFLRVQ